MEIINYLDVGDVVFNDLVDVLKKQIEENEVRTTFGQPLLPYSINVKDFLEKAAEKAREVHAKTIRYSGDSHGSVADWETKAQGRFRDNLLRMVSTLEENSVLKVHLQNQIYEIWPELLPPRNLTSEETDELCKLQEQADTLLDNLKQTIRAGVDDLWGLVMVEQEIIAGTSASNMRLIHDRTQCRLAALAGIIRALWDGKASKLVEPPEQIERRFMHAAPRRWSD